MLLVTAVTYFAGSSLALHLTRFDGGIAIVWIAGAILFSALCASPRRRWSQLVLACIPAAIMASFLFGMRGPVSLALPLICVGEAYAAAWWLKRAYPRFGRFQSVPEVAWFIFIGGVAVPMLTALLAAACAVAGRGIPFWDGWRDWYAGHALGLVAFAPPLLLTLRGQTYRWIGSARRSRQFEAIGLLTLTVIGSLAAFGQNTVPLVVLPLLPMIAATLRFGRFGAVASILILIVVGLSCSLAGSGPTTLLKGSMSLKLQVLQVYFASVVLVLLPLAAELRARRRLVERLRAAEALHRLVLDRTSDIIMRLGPDGTLRYVSPSIEHAWGYRPEELTGKVLFRLISPDDLPAVLEARQSALLNPDATMIAEYRAIRNDGTTLWMETHMRATIDESGKVTGTVSIVREVTGRRQLIEDLTRQSLTDSLTGLHNRRSFDATLEALLSSSVTEGPLGCVALFDLDHFKTINDRFGHAAGDEVLVHFGDLLRQSVRESDLVARIGGEEFGAVLGGIELATAQRICERIRVRLEQSSVDTSGAPIRTTVSVGLCLLSSGQSRADALKAADAALYQAKRDGRNRSSVAA
ncbi:diguanylate cyclase [Novosphingobium resinovorum]|uniref:sensor domain-containing diguanylate cyclase n=1 Tax=Novosphingobium resinovorum TaxID=158500 RepID=UPI002ECFB395|nr:diguanylate cyclase [Novosphingobium resinovorum]